jgi:hypothetical protein
LHGCTGHGVCFIQVHITTDNVIPKNDDGWVNHARKEGNYLLPEQDTNWTMLLSNNSGAWYYPFVSVLCYTAGIKSLICSYIVFVQHMQALAFTLVVAYQVMIIGASAARLGMNLMATTEQELQILHTSRLEIILWCMQIAARL